MDVILLAGVYDECHFIGRCKLQQDIITPWQSATPPSILAVLLCLAYLAKGLKKQCSAFTQINFPPLARVAHVSASNSDVVFVMQSGEVCSYLTFIQLV
jgi:hypothetical protein